MEKKNSVKINFIGIGCGIIKQEVSEALLDRMNELASRMGTTLELALFDGDFFRYLKQEGWDSLYDLKKTGFFVEGLIDGYRNSMEVWVDSKRRRKISHIDLWDTSTLFPNYDLRESESKFKKPDKKYITIVETAIGLIQSYRITTSKFDIDKFSIHLNRVEISAGNVQPIITCVK